LAARAALSMVASILAISLNPAGRISWMSLLSFASKVFQLIKTRGAFSNVGEQVGELSVRGLSHEFQQNFTPRTGDAPRVGKVFMHDPVKCVAQFFFGFHDACPEQNPTIRDRCR
jgi:hypothetical protein